MKAVRLIFVCVLVVALLFTIFLTLHNTQAPSQASTKTITNELSPATSVHEKVVNADSIVYWRSDPNWNTPLTMAQQGVYTGDTVSLACYTRGSTVPPNNNNPLWYWAEVVSGQGQGSGWVNDHFLNTGINQPNIPVNGVGPCPAYPYVWSNTDIATIRVGPAQNYHAFPDNTLYNNFQLTQLTCWIDGGWAWGNYWTNRWFNFPYDNMGDRAFVNASLVANQPTLPQCDSGLAPDAMVTLAQGPLVSSGTYHYAITLSSFSVDTSFSVECYDSERPSGFAQFTMTTDGSGNASTQSECYSGDGPDHWIVVGWITSNYVQWGDVGNSKPPSANPTVTLAQGPLVSGSIYRYAITLSGFPANTSVSVECYDSVSRSGFFHFTITTDGSGNASTQSECYSGDGPDHWVVAGEVTSNYVQWGRGNTNTPQPPTPTPTATPTPSPTTEPAPTTYTEQEGHHGVSTFADPYNASGMGQKIAAAAWVQVTCKVYAPQIQSANPDGYWYRIASSPWNNAYYAPANTFMNGDPWGGPYTHNTDFNVPNC